MANDCVPYFENGGRISTQATAAVTGKRFVAPSASLLSGPGIPATAQIGASDPVDGGNVQVAHCPAGATPLGVAQFDQAIGDHGGAICEGVVPITAAANIAFGAAVEVGANGQVQTWAGTIATAKVGICLTAALSGADAMIRLML